LANQLGFEQLTCVLNSGIVKMNLQAQVDLTNNPWSKHTIAASTQLDPMRPGSADQLTATFEYVQLTLETRPGSLSLLDCLPVTFVDQPVASVVVDRNAELRNWRKDPRRVVRREANLIDYGHRSTILVWGKSARHADRRD